MGPPADQKFGTCTFGVLVVCLSLPSLCWVSVAYYGDEAGQVHSSVLDWPHESSRNQ